MSDTLFDPSAGEPPRTRTGVPADQAPLAVRLRPRTLDELVGQQHLLREGSALRRALDEGHAHSMVLYGPPGTGKTTIARLVAGAARAAFEELSAVEAGRAEVRAVLERAAHRRAATGEATVFFLDEIHRFNKAQQDALLPAVEEGLVVLIGATTENPYFEVNSALLSRTHVYELEPLSAADIETLLRRALERGEVGDARVDDEALAFLAERAAGDARTALAALEVGAVSGHVTLAVAEDALQRRAVRYDKAGDQHYDLISAWIKSTRGSDPDASLYYLAVMLEGGEDPRFVARRMIVLASEDVGNADPQALQIAVAAAHAVDHVGMPECVHALAQAAIYLSLAPKSNAAYRAIAAARAHVREHGAQPPPQHLRSAAYPGAKALGRGEGYDYPHGRPGRLSEQELMPAGLEGVRFYDPDEAEARFLERLKEVLKARGRTT
ncbi:MAG: replication-associated recombination protein A [Actinobacteria bacterium]|nr:MAG: replication-associated recombination protein A [Actinomycetota bacterium]